MFVKPPTPEDWARLAPLLGRIRSFEGTAINGLDLISNSMLVDFTATGIPTQPLIPGLVNLQWTSSPKSKAWIFLAGPALQILKVTHLHSKAVIDFGILFSRLPTVSPNLVELDFSFSELSAPTMEALVAALRALSRLRSVALRKLQSISEILAALHQHRNLNSIYLSSSKSHSDFMDESNSDFFPAIDDLTLQSPHAEQLPSLLRSISLHRSLKKVSYSRSSRHLHTPQPGSNKTQLLDLKRLVDATALHNHLQVVEIRHSVTTLMLKDVWPLVACTDLHRLKISNNGQLALTDDDFESFVAHFPKLKYLQLRRDVVNENDENDDGPAPLTSLEVLAHIVLSCPEIEHIGVDFHASHIHGTTPSRIPTTRGKRLGSIDTGYLLINMEPEDIAFYLASLSDVQELEVSVWWDEGDEDPRLDTWRNIACTVTRFLEMRGQDTDNAVRRLRGERLNGGWKTWF